MKLKSGTYRRLFVVLVIALLVLLPVFPVFATSTNTDVAGAVTTAWNTYGKPQIKNLCNNFIFRLIDGILVVALVLRFAFVEFKYRKNGGQFEWGALAVLGGSFLFMLTAPLWVWNVIGW